MSYEDPPKNNCRIFIGNLPSEKTSKEEIFEIFSKYGNITDEIVLRKSFGFVQYDNPQSAQAALAAEQGRQIGGMHIDLNFADSRAPKKDNNNFRNNQNRNGQNFNRNNNNNRRSRSRSPPSRRGKRRSISPVRDGSRNKRQNRDLQSGSTMMILHIGQQSEGYGYELKDIVLNEYRGFSVDVSHVLYKVVPEVVADTERKGYRYAIVVGRHSEQKRTMTLHIFGAHKPDVYTDISIDQALSMIGSEEARQRQQHNVPTSTLVNPAYVPQLMASQPMLQALGMAQIQSLLATQQGINNPSYAPQSALYAQPQANLVPQNIASSMSQSGIPLQAAPLQANVYLPPTTSSSAAASTTTAQQQPSLNSLLSNTDMLQSLLTKLSQNTSTGNTASFQQQPSLPANVGQSQYTNNPSSSVGVNTYGSVPQSINSGYSSQGQSVDNSYYGSSDYANSSQNTYTDPRKAATVPQAQSNIPYYQSYNPSVGVQQNQYTTQQTDPYNRSYYQQQYRQ